jgi:hypothetical protein
LWLPVADAIRQAQEAAVKVRSLRYANKSCKAVPFTDEEHIFFLSHVRFALKSHEDSAGSRWLIGAIVIPLQHRAKQFFRNY